MNRTRQALAALILGFAALSGGCGHDIGDDCKTSVDCDPSGTRACDLSQPGGYCTILGCDETLCPSGATCIRTFPETLLAQNAHVAVTSATCDPEVATMSQCPAEAMCGPFGSCVRPCDATAATTTCPAGQLCLPAGYCAQCDPAREDVPSDAGPPLDDCLADEICLDTGLCAKEAYEQRQCAKSCSSNGDCRGGYECRKTGLLGSMVLATNPNAMTAFCAPHVVPPSMTTP